MNKSNHGITDVNDRIEKHLVDTTVNNKPSLFQILLYRVDKEDLDVFLIPFL